MTQIYDLSDPAKPVFIREFGLPGQQPGGAGPPPAGLHGAISTGPNGNRVYFGYGTAAGGVVQIVDREKLLNGPKEPTDQNLLSPQIGRLDLPPNVGAHTVFPVLRMEIPEFGRQTESGVRDFVVITNESTANECREARQMVWVADITTESKPFGVSNWTVPEASGNFCGRGGRFGTHSSNENLTLIYYKRVMFFAHFNAGVRAVDIRDPFHPKEIGFYIPAITDKTDKRCVDTGTSTSAARWRSRPTTSRSTTAATSTSSIVPTPGCTSSSSAARRAESPTCRSPKEWLGCATKSKAQRVRFQRPEWSPFCG